MVQAMTNPEYPQEPHAPYGQPSAPGAPGAGPGAGAEVDPGFRASLSHRTPLGTLRMLALSLAAAPLLIGVIVAIIVVPAESVLPPLLPYAVIAGSGLVSVAIGRMVPRPLDPMAESDQTGRAAVAAFRQAMMIRFASAEATVLVGLPMCFLVGSPLPYAASLAIGFPLLVWLVVPTRAMIENVRRRLEERGAVSNLWTGLVTNAD
jgi:hypothetical protein